MFRKLLFAFLLLNAHCLILTLSQSVETTPKVPSFPTTAAGNGSDTSTPSPSTTTIPTITSTTTEKPTTETTTKATTTKPTTTSTPSSTTVVTTTLPPPPPTPAPTPDKFPKNIGNWTVMENNVTCILFKGALDVVMSIQDEKTNKTTKAEVVVPKKAIASGKCGEKNQEITLTWTAESNPPTPSAISNDNTLSFFFSIESNSTKYQLEEIAGSVYPNKNSTTPVTFKLENLSAHAIPTTKSYKCNTEETIKSKADPDVQIKVANVQMEAFHTTADAKYSVADECAADGYVADIVPIAVGCSLAGLVIIVLIAYLFGRRRARARGYQSV